MEYLNLYLTFFKLGIVNFGGGYAMLPLLERELVFKKKWTTKEELIDYYAVGQCTPGAIAVNVSTFIGYKRKGVLGGILATLGFVSPAFIIIFIIASLLTNFSDNKYVSHALAGIRVVVFFLVLSSIVKIFKSSCSGVMSKVLAIVVGILAIALDIPLYLYVIIAAVFGMVFNIIKEKNKKEIIEENKEDSSNNIYIKDKVEKPKKKKLMICFDIVVALSAFLLIMLCCIVVSLVKDNSIIFKLYFQFFKIGLCAFGGGLATLPFLKELSINTSWFSLTELANMIAVSESTPGAMGINMSTYVGYMVSANNFGNMFLNFISSIISTLGLVTPSIIVISLVAIFLEKFKNNKYVSYAFYGLRAASVGLMIAALYSIAEVALMQNSNIVEVFRESYDTISIKSFFPNLSNALNEIFNFKNIAVGLIFGILIFKYKKHPVFYILLGAMAGIILWM